MGMKIDFTKIQDLKRSITFDKNAVNEDSRTVTLAFSSEMPVERYFGLEILDHSVQSVRLGRLTDGSPLLLNHDPEKQIGVIESVEIGADRIGRAVVRLGKGELATEIFNDIVDGIRSKVSVGYMIHGATETKENGQDVYRATDWEPYEISIVSIPADISVGVGRSAEFESQLTKENEEDKMKKDETNDVAETPKATVDTSAVLNEVRQKEVERISEINALGAKFSKIGGTDLAREFIAKGSSIQDAQSAFLERAASTKPTTITDDKIGMNESEIKSFSMVRLINVLANKDSQEARKAASFELEVCETAARKANKEVRGFLVPTDVLYHGKRDLNTGTSTAGGNLVATNLQAGSFIELLRNKLALTQLGATVLTGLEGNVSVPKQTGGATAYWLSEGSAPTETQQSIGQVQFQPKTVGAFTDYTRRLLLQSSVDVESMVRNDLARVLALAIDYAGLYGTGSSGQPQGLKNISGVLTKDFAANTPIYAEVVDLETLVAAQNADVAGMAYLTNSTMKGSLKTAPKVSGYPDFIMNADNNLNGYRTVISNQVASNDLWFGDWTNFVMAMWGGLDIMLDPYANSTSGGVRIIALQDVDLNVRQTVSFVRGNNTL